MGRSMTGTRVVQAAILLQFAATQSPCRPDPCSNGFCETTGDDSYTCQCSAGWTGETCDELRTCDLECDQGSCEWKIADTVDESDAASCVCDDGYIGDLCDTEASEYDPCESAVCNFESCVVEDGRAVCDCDRGLHGDGCETQMRTCDFNFLLNVATTVYHEDHNAGIDCKYWIGLMWADARGNDVTNLAQLCTCLAYIREHMSGLAQDLGCVIEEQFPMSLQAEWDYHCSTCSDMEILAMKDVLRNTTPECDSFIGYRSDQPLVWRTWLKCECLMSLGDRDAAAELITCPFSDHPARTDMVAYDNCKASHDGVQNVRICEFDEIKTAIEETLYTRYPEAVEICSGAMKELFDITPTPWFGVVAGEWCKCFNFIQTWWEEGLEILNCHPITFWEFTLTSAWQTYCNDKTFTHRDFLWDISAVVLPISNYDYSVGNTCYNAITFVAAYSVVDGIQENTDFIDRAWGLVCECVHNMESLIDEHDFSEPSWVAEIQPMVDTWLGEKMGFYSLDCDSPKGGRPHLMRFKGLTADLDPDGGDDDTEETIFLVANSIVGTLAAALCILNVACCFRRRPKGPAAVEATPAGGPQTEMG